MLRVEANFGPGIMHELIGVSTSNPQLVDRIKTVNNRLVVSPVRQQTNLGGAGFSGYLMRLMRHR